MGCAPLCVCAQSTPGSSVPPSPIDENAARKRRRLFSVALMNVLPLLGEFQTSLSGPSVTADTPLSTQWTYNSISGGSYGYQREAARIPRPEPRRIHAYH